MPGTEGFEFPGKLQIAEGATSTFAKFIVEPLVHGFGNTIGNAMRRVLLSSMEGVAVSSIRIDGVSHEFCTIENVIEDVMDIVLNVKKLKFTCDGDLPRTLELVHDKEGEVTGRDIREDGVTKVLNPEQVICTLDKDTTFRMELEIDRGRGYRPSELNKVNGQPLGTILVDCLFSPIEGVSYDVQACRVGQQTDYDRLELCVWTDGRIDPVVAVNRSADILMRHLEVFNGMSGDRLEQESSGDHEDTHFSQEEEERLEVLCRSVNDLKLSVRAQNVLQALNVNHLIDLVKIDEESLSGHRNCGRKTVQEITQKLKDLNLDMGEKISERIEQEVDRRLKEQQANENQGE